MSYSVIALDLDGTLLNAGKEVSGRNLNAVLNCSRRGMKIIIATARPPRSVRSMLPQALLDAASFVCYNGAVVTDEAAGIGEHVPIPRDLAAELLEYCKLRMPECTISVEVNDVWYAAGEIDDFEFFNPRFRPVVLPIDELKRHDATKILLSSFSDLESLIQLFGNRMNIVVTDQGKLLQAMNKDISKESGILRLCRHYGVPASQIIAFGDDLNDAGMLRIAGYAVAMGNAVQPLKEMADEITVSNEEDGVAHVLERFLC